MSDQQQNSGSSKGRFGRIGLSVAKKYPSLRSRSTFYLIGLFAAVALGIIFSVDATLTKGALVSNGPLSSNHASFGDDCSSCHTPLEGVVDQQCMVCHEKFGDKLGIHTFDRHYLYRSGDFSRVATGVNEVTCATCHPEHDGHEAQITEISDAQCETCHDIGSFNTDHPEFQVIAENAVDEANLKFPHTLHVSELQRRENYSDIEKACLHCHNADADGKGFQPIDFETQCDACHLSSSTATPFLPISSSPTVPGVQSLETIAASQRAGTRWAFYTNPNEFQTRGSSIRKRPVYHADPWILENLRRLRNTLYPSSNLADLLKTSADVAPHDADVLYEEALETLATFAEELRNQPDRAVQAELAKVEELLERVRLEVQDPLKSRDETQFIVSAASLNASLSVDQVESFQQTIDQLTQPCQECHLVEEATIQRVQTNQQTLIRSDFNHRAHIIQARCMDCHNVIPVQQFAALDSIPPPDLDRASIHNLPSISSCQTCHAEEQASNTCITCHAFHPDKSQRSNLLLYTE